VSDNLVPKVTNKHHPFKFECRKFLLEAAAKVGIEGAEEFLKNPNNGLKEVIFFQNKKNSFMLLFNA